MSEKGAHLLGHAIHPMLIVFPLGLLATSLIFDIVFLSTHAVHWLDISYWMIVAGVIGGLAAAVFGLIDWIAIPSGTRAKAVGAWHGIGNAVVMVLFIISWWLRTARPEETGDGRFVLSFIGVGLALVTGWLGGELVDRLGIGIHPGAHPNAPSSLSDRPASEQAQPGGWDSLRWPGGQAAGS